MRVILALLAVVLAGIAGAGGAWWLTPSERATAAPVPLAEPAHVTLPREFVVPLIAESRVRGHAVLTLGIHSATLDREVLLTREAVLRDRMLEALFRHAAAGGFDDRFTDAAPMARLRIALNEAASAALAPDDATVLVTSIDRRDR